MSNVFKVSIDSLLLDRNELILDANGLNVQQVDVLQLLIAYFRKSNTLENYVVEFHSNELHEKLPQLADSILYKKQ